MRSFGPFNKVIFRSKSLITNVKTSKMERGAIILTQRNTFFFLFCREEEFAERELNIFPETELRKAALSISRE